MIFRFVSVSVVLLACGFVSASQFPPRAGATPPAVPPIFSRAIAAADHVNYAGTRTVEIQTGAIRTSHSEYVLHSGQNSRVWFPAGTDLAGQVVIETAKERLHYYPRRNTVEVLPPKSEQAFVRLKNWVQNPGPRITLTAVNGGNVAGRPTTLGTVSDKRGNVRQRIWMDNQSGVILKRVVLDQVGAQVGFFQFTQIDFNPIIRPGDFAIQVRGAIRLTLHDKLHELAARNGLLPLEVKQNQYVLDGVSMVRPTGISVLHETYAGPKGKLSLFQVAGLVDLSHIKPTDERGLAFFGWQLNGHSFALIGNYSVPELKQLSTQLGEVRNGK